MLSSALEHITPEQMFTDAAHPGEAVSAVRAIQKATQQGQRIYQLTAQNITTAIPNIHHDANTMGEIRNAVNAGKEVITHTDAIQVPGWSGAGYIIVDSETGAGAYKIAGGENGGFLLGVLFASSLISILVLAATTIAATGLAGVALIAFIATQIGPVIAVGINNINNLMASMDDTTRGCFLQGFFTTLSIAGLTRIAPLLGIGAGLGELLGYLGLLSSFVDDVSTTECLGF